VAGTLAREPASAAVRLAGRRSRVCQCHLASWSSYVSPPPVRWRAPELAPCVYPPSCVASRPQGRVHLSWFPRFHGPERILRPDKFPINVRPIGYRGASCGQRPLFFCAHGMNGVPAGSCVAIRDWPCGNPQLFPAHPQALHKSSTDPSTGTGSESLLPGSWGGAGAAQVPAPGPNARRGLAAGHRMPPGPAAARERGGPPPISDLLPAWQLRPARHRQAP